MERAPRIVLVLMVMVALSGTVMAQEKGYSNADPSSVRQPPPNDACADAVLVAPGSATVGTNLAVVVDDFPAGDFCGTTITSPGLGVWYQVVGTGNTLTVSTCNATDYDSKLSVFCDGCGTTTCVGGNDDGVGCAGFSSLYSFCSRAGFEYLIYVHGFLAAQGNFTLSVTDDQVPCTASDSCSIVPVELLSLSAQ